MATTNNSLRGNDPPWTVANDRITEVGVRWSSLSMAASWPLLLSPQQEAVPSARTAHVFPEPAEMATALVTPVTTSGTDRGLVVELPSSPLSFFPQQFRPPMADSAQVWSLAAEMPAVMLSPETMTGTGETGSACPSPSL